MRRLLKYKARHLVQSTEKHSPKLLRYAAQYMWRLLTVAGVGCGLDGKEEGGRREGGPADATWDARATEEEERGTRGDPMPGDCCIMGGGIRAPPTGDPAGPTGGPGSPGGLPLTRHRDKHSHINIIISQKHSGKKVPGGN